MEEVIFLWWKHWLTGIEESGVHVRNKCAFIHHFFCNLWRSKPEGGGRPEDTEELELSKGGEGQWGGGNVLLTTASMLIMWKGGELPFFVRSFCLQYCHLTIDNENMKAMIGKVRKIKRLHWNTWIMINIKKNLTIAIELSFRIGVESKLRNGSMIFDLLLQPCPHRINFTIKILTWATNDSARTNTMTGGGEEAKMSNL
jgi:hypothetical protein